MDGRDVAGSAPRLTGPLSWLARGATAMTDEWDSISSHKGYVTVAADEHGRPVLLEIRMSKSGGLLRGLMDCLAASVSLGLQRGVPLSDYVALLALARFEPADWTDSEVGYAHSVVDYVARWLGLRFPGAGAVEQPAEAVQGETCAYAAGR